MTELSGKGAARRKGPKANSGAITGETTFQLRRTARVAHAVGCPAWPGAARLVGIDAARAATAELECDFAPSATIRSSR